ncbi:hypothetical protein RRF57_000485 [Xylaria bambusicola]|uniref:Uncharacterized protein n=1 Tax=Xylaria bambusicola TaxID=326684 RepID=A0AAN7UNP6_9PEZI
MGISFHTSDKDYCTSKIRVGILVEALIQRSRNALEVYYRQGLSVFGTRPLDCCNEDAHDDEACCLPDINRRPRDVWWWLLINAEVVSKKVGVVHEADDAKPDARDAVGVEAVLEFQPVRWRGVVALPAVRPSASKRDSAECLAHPYCRETKIGHVVAKHNENGFDLLPVNTHAAVV